MSGDERRERKGAREREKRVTKRQETGRKSGRKGLLRNARTKTHSPVAASDECCCELSSCLFSSLVESHRVDGWLLACVSAAAGSALPGPRAAVAAAVAVVASFLEERKKAKRAAKRMQNATVQPVQERMRRRRR